MIYGLEGLLVGSANPKRLADFYKDTVKLKLTMEMEVGDSGESGYGFDLGNKLGMFIMKHDQVHGANKEPGRIIINLEVDNIEKEVERMKKANVKLTADIYHIQDYGKVATFEDPDGNYFQFVKTRA